MTDRPANSLGGAPRDGPAREEEVPTWASSAVPSGYPYGGWSPDAQSQTSYPPGGGQRPPPPHHHQQHQQQAYFDAYSRVTTANAAAAAAAAAPYGYMYGYPGMPGPPMPGVAAVPYEAVDAAGADNPHGRSASVGEQGDPANLFPFNPYATGFEGGYQMPPAAFPYMNMAPGYPMQAAFGYGMAPMNYAGAPPQRPPPMRNVYVSGGAPPSGGGGGGGSAGGQRGRGAGPSRPASTGASAGRSDAASPRPRRRQSSGVSLSSTSSGPSAPRPPSGSGTTATSPTGIGPGAALPRPPAAAQDQPPQQAARSEHVMWVGNVPTDATIPELWQLFGTLPPAGSNTSPTDSPSKAPSPSNLVTTSHADEVPAAEILNPLASASSHGILSIFIISRSNCAFVNYLDATTLSRAVTFFSGKSLRPHDPHCPRLVCRVRKKDEEVQAGVGGQRGRGLHVAYVKEHERKRKEQGKPDTALPDFDSLSVRVDQSTPVAEEGTPKQLAVDRSPASSGVTRPALSHEPSSGSISNSSGSVSYTSTNSSLLRHPAFRERFFILKSHSLEELQRSVETGTWATQPHNEDVLDQAYRNSQSVYLFFSANQSGEWFGVARMAGSIKPNGTTPGGRHDAKSPLSKRPPNRPSTIVEESSVEDSTGHLRVPTTSAPTVDSPSAITPLDEDQKPLGAYPAPTTTASPSLMSSSPLPYAAPGDPLEAGIVRKDMLSEGDGGSSLGSSSVAPSDSVSMNPSPRDLEQLAVRALIHNLRLEERESSQKATELEQSLQADGANASASPAASRAAQPIGHPFKVDWLMIKPMPFGETRKLRNPWRDNRQVKVSRDGTELEPTVGREMLELLEKYQPPSQDVDRHADDAAGDLEQEDDDV